MPLDIRKKSGDAPTSLPTEENIQNENSTSEPHLSSSLSQQALDELTNLLIDCGEDVTDIYPKYDQCHNLTGFQIDGQRHGKFVSAKKMFRPARMCREIIDAVMEVDA